MKSNQAGGSSRRKSDSRPSRGESTQRPTRSTRSAPSHEDIILQRLAHKDYRPTTAEVLITMLSISEQDRPSFLATLDQVHLGIWAVQEKWFKSFIVLHQVKDFPLPVFPGGYFIGGLLLINLIVAHAKRFVFTWKKAGIQLVHSGLILLLLGELFTGLYQEEYQMRLDEGQTRNYSESWRFNELAVADVTQPDEELVTAIPEALLGREKPIVADVLPFRLIPRAYFPNASLTMREQLPAGQRTVENTATKGLGPRLAITPMAKTYKMDQRNLPAALVEVVTPEGESLGTFLVSTMLIEPESFTAAGRQWQLSLRFQRAYKPYSLTLLDFSHDRYAGTDIPKNFSSRVRLVTPDGSQDREVLIFMNNPLRFDGMTFFQAGFDNNDRTTVLQVVRNPSWVIPYLSCLMMAVGLFWQFGWHLVLFTARRGDTRSAAALAPALPGPVVALGLILSLRIFAGLVGLWVSASADGTPAVIGLAVLAAEFLVCAALLFGLVARRAWVGGLLSAYAWFTVILLAGVTAYGFFGGDIYDAILRWVIIGVHLLTAAGLLALARNFTRPETRAYLAATPAEA